MMVYVPLAALLVALLTLTLVTAWVAFKEIRFLWRTRRVRRYIRMSQPWLLRNVDVHTSDRRTWLGRMQF